MGIKTAWDSDEKSAIHITYERPWDWKDFEAAQREINMLMGSTEQIIDLIFDVRYGGPPPPGAITRFRQVVQTQHLNRGMIIFVGSTATVQTFLNLILRIYGKTIKAPNFIFASSLEEARLILLRQRKV